MLLLVTIALLLVTNRRALSWVVCNLCLAGRIRELRGTVGYTVDMPKVLERIKRNKIVFTIFRLICKQTDVISVWFQSNRKKGWENGDFVQFEFVALART